MKINRQSQGLDDVLEALDHRLTFAENIQCKKLTVISGAADTEFLVTHNLGKTPSGYIANTDTGGVVYSSSQDSWTTSFIFLKCTQPNTKISLVIF